LVGISFVTFISWFRGTVITYFPDTEDGDARFEYFKQVVNVEPMSKILANFTSDLHAAGLALVVSLRTMLFL